MELDDRIERYNVRERDNRVSIVLSQPGWACKTNYDYWYVSIEDLPESTNVWVHRKGSTYLGDKSRVTAIRVAKEYYDKEAKILK